MFGSVAELGDLAHQRATWLDPEMQNPHFSYVEFVECFYDACGGLDAGLVKDAPDAPFSRLVREGILSSEERDLLWEVHLALAAYQEPDGHYNHAAILDDPAWHSVVAVASSVTATLQSLLAADDDPRAFENHVPTAKDKRWP